MSHLIEPVSFKTAGVYCDKTTLIKDATDLHLADVFTKPAQQKHIITD